MDDGWRRYALLALAIVAWWFIQAEFSDFKAQNKAQWAKAADMERCLTKELADLRVKVAFIEGLHKGQEDVRRPP